MKIKLALCVLLAGGQALAADAPLPCRAADPDNPRPRIGLVLGGGGARGIAHLSVLKEIERQGIPVDCIAGTSMGSLVGGLYASGMSTADMETMLRTMDWNTVMKDTVARQDRSFRRKQDDLESLAPAKPGIGKNGLRISSGLLAGENIQLFLERQIAASSGVTDFNRLPIPYRAVATDINTGKAVVLDSGSLAKAMRASMSIPGAFNPVTIDGRILVDGGLVNQVPVDVVRAMGADIVIAVDVGTPLSAITSESSALAIGDQVMGLLTVGNTQAQLATLGPKDILIQPDLGKEVTTASFEKAALALEIGDKAAAAAAPRLAALARPELPARQPSPNRDAQTRVAFIELDNRTEYDDRLFTRHLNPLKGKAIDRDAIDEHIHAIYGQYPLELVSYEVVEKQGETGLKVTVTPPVVGKYFGEYGLNFSGSSKGQFLFNITTGVTITPMNPSGGELRTLLTLGDEPSLTSEWYQPLAPASPFFTDIRVGYEKPLLSLVDGNENVLVEYAAPTVFMSAKLGRSYGNWGELSLQANIANGRLERNIGSTSFPEYDYQRRELALGFTIDTVDSLYLPRNGNVLEASVVSSVDAWGSDDDYRQFNFDLLHARAIGKHSGFAGLRYHNTFSGNAGFQNYYSLGGVTRFAGYQAQQQFAENYALAFAGYNFELGKLLGRSLVLGGSLERGKIWYDSAIVFDDYQTHGSVYLGFDSWIGLLMMGYGHSNEGDSNIFIELGRTR
jgi:NTE family protein